MSSGRVFGGAEGGSVPRHVREGPCHASRAEADSVGSASRSQPCASKGAAGRAWQTHPSEYSPYRTAT
eukprot:81645-Prymnesium_polylepis.1